MMPVHDDSMVSLYYPSGNSLTDAVLKQTVDERDQISLVGLDVASVRRSSIIAQFKRPDTFVGVHPRTQHRIGQSLQGPGHARDW
jgi:hypothetical protein